MTVVLSAGSRCLVALAVTEGRWDCYDGKIENMWRLPLVSQEARGGSLRSTDTHIKCQDVNASYSIYDYGCIQSTSLISFNMLLSFNMLWSFLLSIIVI